RDLYDLIWYLSDPGWPPPNLVWLNNALNQTNWQGVQLTETTWKNALMQKIQHMDLSRARADVLPFLENPAEGAFITQDNLLHILS
ncbi:MAG: hypothetical protein K8R91_02885, partial [Phycisphaerae bacterium]|nr:hypothetical protein [Phycisphaerae bacterium]